MKHFLVLLLVPLCGCVGVARVTRELGKDNATVVVRMNSIYGSGQVVRANPSSGHQVKVLPDGTVTIGVPSE